MNNTRLRSWAEAREELRRASGESAAEALDEELARGRKVSAIRMLKAHGIAIEADRS